MSKWLAGFGVLAVLATGTAMGAEMKFLSLANYQELSVRADKVGFAISYPGKLSGVCGVEIKFNDNWVSGDAAQKILAGLVVSENGQRLSTVKVAEVGRSFTQFNLDNTRSVYQTYVTVQTVNRKPLADYFRSVSNVSGLPRGTTLSAILVAKACE